MRDRTVNRVESWDARPFSGGFSTLRDMSDASFSGVVVSGDAWLFMLNGRIVGIVDGDIDDFEDASGTMYEAPDPALPLLFSMQERGGTTQAKYYTNDTPLGDADRTLSDANFTGYVELSENVLSGDYYLVYYGGRALPVAFVGTTNELKTGDEAYDLATDEVGVYEVIKTPVNVTQVPAPRSDDADTPDSASADSAAAGAAASGANASDTDETDVAGEDGDTVTVEQTEAPGDDSGTGGEPTTAAETDVASTTESTPAPDADSSQEPSAEVAAAEEYEGSVDDTVVESAEPSDAGSTEQIDGSQASPEEAGAKPGAKESIDAAGTADRPDETSRGQPGAESHAAESSPDDSSVFSEEEQWRQTKSIPSLSPSEREKRRKQQENRSSGSEQRARRPRSETTQDAAEPSQQSAAESQSQEPTEAGVETGASKSPRQRQSESGTTESTGASNAESGRTTPPTSGTGGADTGAQPTSSQSDGGESGGQPSAELKQRLTKLQTKLERLSGERDGLLEDLESVRAERDELQRRVRQLETALEEAGGTPSSGPTLTPDEALAGTNLFVRYGSRGAPTLDELTGKNPDPEAINKNLRIDHHTQFESQDASVDGAPFTEFLEGTSSYRFVSWLVRDLPYEVLDAGHRNDLGELYDVIPEIDRAELQGVVEVEGEDDAGTERREFDIVLRDRMGNPLVVAELNDERDPVSGDEMETLIESAQVIGEGAGDLGAAFYVTASFFEPNALENAAAATESGGILSRSDRASFVKLARKQGFHLCLAEDRNDTFHLTVPEL